MTFRIDGTDVGQAIEIAMAVGGVLAMLVIGLLVYLMVRPPRRRAEPKMKEPDALDMEEMLGLLDRMESRLEVLERTVGDEDRPRRVRAADRQELLEAGEERPENGRIK